jgi:hypothetical protein
MMLFNFKKVLTTNIGNCLQGLIIKVLVQVSPGKFQEQGSLIENSDLYSLK